MLTRRVLFFLDFLEGVVLEGVALEGVVLEGVALEGAALGTVTEKIKLK